MLRLEQNNIELWCANLDLAKEQIEELAKTLSEDEKNRAERYYFKKHRDRFIVARGILRKIIANYLNIKPTELEFKYSERGKPSLINKQLEFNLSHSEAMAIYGFSLNRKIGVDLEHLRHFPEAENITKRFFSSNEYQVIKNLLPDDKYKAFFRGWTAKEAYLKAIGEGIALGLNTIEIELNINKPLQFLNIQGWSLYEVILNSEYIAAVAIEGEIKAEQIKYYYINNSHHDFSLQRHFLPQIQ